MREKRAEDEFALGTLFRTSLLWQTKEFFNNSTLHGVRYIAEHGRPFIERFMWFCFTAIGAVAAFIIIVSLWEKFQTNPTITGLDTDFHTQHVIFPTILICPLEPFDETKAREFADEKMDRIGLEFGQFEDFLKSLTKLSYANLDEAVKASEEILSDSNLDELFLRSAAFGSSISCPDLFVSCEFRDDPIECCKSFLPKFTEHGFCYAFNPRFRETETTVERYDLQHELLETDRKWAIHFALQRSAAVFVHAQSELSGWDFRPQLEWRTDFSSDILITMKQTYTTEEARQLSIGQRKCIFPNEVRIKNFPFDEDYTFTGCMMDCRIEKAVKLCKCLPPFYHSIPGSLTPYCTAKDLSCLSRFARNITQITDCRQCELSCLNTVYDVDKLTKASNAESAHDGGAYINVEYLTWPIIRYKREVLFGWVDLLVSFGGIAGLFLGFSLLSGVEILYYFSLRAFCMIYKDRQVLEDIEQEKANRPPQRVNLSLKMGKGKSEPQEAKTPPKHAIKLRKHEKRLKITPFKQSHISTIHLSQAQGEKSLNFPYLP
ncbi:sodium channel protein Nach [Phlebotomus argentipes]|uniref:sodium channel protein Nach n=1 Tax=Phlebotomus argentipes TaxID=94469 RepID=UPI002892C8ED|nr:sodium channel protein Nach [Phlebotomus argentipes]